MINVTPIYVGNGDTFQTWLLRTNTMIDIIAANAVTADSTANGSFTSGNVYIQGSLAANTIAMTTLRGGNVQTSTVLTVTGNVNFASNTLFVDAINNRVGVGTGSPTTALSVNGAISSTTATIGEANVTSILTVANASVNNLFVNTVVGSFTVNATATFTNTTTFNVIPVLPGSDPSTANQAARKAYVDTQRDTRVAKAGDTMTGALVLPASDPVGNNDAARKAYVDVQRDTRVAKAGDTMTGALVLPASDPVGNNDAAHKAYVDAGDRFVQIASVAPPPGSTLVEIAWTAGAYRAVKAIVAGFATQGVNAGNFYVQVFRGGALVQGASNYHSQRVWWWSATGAVAYFSSAAMFLTGGGVHTSLPIAGEFTLTDATAQGGRINMVGLISHTIFDPTTAYAQAFSSGEVLGGSGQLSGLRVGIDNVSQPLSGTGRLIVLGIKS